MRRLWQWVRKDGLGTRSAVALLARVAGAALGFLFLALITRSLGVSSSGTFFLAQEITHLVVLIGLAGMDTALIADASAPAARGDHAAAVAVWRRAARIVTLTTTALVAILLLTAPWIANLMDDPSLTHVLRIIVLGSLPITLSVARSSWLVATGRFITGVGLRAVGAIAPTVVIFALIGRHHGTEGAAWSYLAGNVVFLLLAWLLGRSGHQLASRPPATEVRDRSSNQAYLAADLVEYGRGHGDVLFLGWLASSQVVALYVVAVRIGRLLVFVIEAVNTALGPRFAALYRNEGIEPVEALFARVTRALALFGILGGLAFALVSPVVLDLFGAGFGPALVPLLIVLMGAVINLSTGPNSLVLNMIGRGRSVRNVLAATLGLQAVALVTLAPPLGAAGAAIARTLALALDNTACIWILRGIGVRLGPRTRSSSTPRT